MAVYTEVPDDEMAAFVARYGIGELLSAKGIAEGVENSNYLIRTTQGAFILTLYEKRVNPDDLPFFLGLIQHLASRGVICPQPVSASRGAMLGRLAHPQLSNFDAASHGATAVFVAALFLAQQLGAHLRYKERIAANDALFAIALACAMAAMILFAPAAGAPFIYFQF